MQHFCMFCWLNRVTGLIVFKGTKGESIPLLGGRSGNEFLAIFKTWIFEVGQRERGKEKH